MDSSRLTEIRRNQAMTSYTRQNPTMNRFASSIDYVYGEIGGIPTVFRNAITGSQLPIVTEADVTPQLQPPVLAALSDLLTYVAAQNFGPTRNSRFFYLFFFSVTASYNTIAGSKTGVHDGWDWGVRLTVDRGSWYSWIEQTLAFCMPSLIPGWTNGITSYTSDFTVFSARWTTWYSTRDADADGSVSALTPPPYTDLNHNTTTNAITYIDVATSQDFNDTTNYQDPARWTPLTIGTSKKNYLTYGWGNVRSPSLTAGDETAATAAADVYYASGSARTAEILSLLDISQTLTDEQKVIAEFWAGGPNTVTPPGMSIWFWKEYMLCQTVSLDTFFYSGLDLAIGLFEASRLCWTLKRRHMQARPIQEIRRTYPSSNITKYDGTTVVGNVWIPFQPANVVTPPFPDFPSGHATFTQIFAHVMTDWFGSTLPNVEAPFSQVSLLSPILGNQSGRYGRFTVGSNSLEAQTTAPASPVTLSFTIWQDMSDQACSSRMYGGIHAGSANGGGQTLANALRVRQKANWLLR